MRRFEFGLKALTGLFITLGLFVLPISVAAQTEQPQASAPATSTDADANLDAKLVSLRSKLEIHKNNSNLAADVKKIVVDNYTAAITRIEEAINSRQATQNNLALSRSASDRIAQVKTEIEQTRQSLQQPLPEATSDMTQDEFTQLRQDEVVATTQLSSLRATADRRREQADDLVTRNTTLQQELAETTAALEKARNDFQALDLADSSLTAVSRRDLLDARLTYFRQRVAELNTESASLPIRRTLNDAELRLANQNVQVAERKVKRLQELTGESRMAEARTALVEAQAELISVADEHPYITEEAERNVELAKQLVDFARKAARIPLQVSDVNTAIDEIEADTGIKNALSSHSEIGREAAQILREIRNEIPQDVMMRNMIEFSESQLVAAQLLRERSRSELRIFKDNDDGDAYNIFAQVDAWLKENPDAPPLSADDQVVLGQVMRSRQQLLQRVADAALDQIGDYAELNAKQRNLQEVASALAQDLDENLLWLPSAAPVSLDWPAKIYRGAADFVNLRNFNSAVEAFKSGLSNSRIISLIALVLFILALAGRRRYRLELASMKGKVGRVKEDSYWHTPIAVLACMALIAPIVIAMFWAAIVFSRADTLDTFPGNVRNMFISLAFFFLVFLSLREWAREGSLFSRHFRMEDGFRKRILKHLRWFIPVGAIFAAIRAITDGGRSPDVYEGISLFAFLVVTIATAWFVYKICFGDGAGAKSEVKADRFFERHKRLFFFAVIFAPLATGIAALSGYFETAVFVQVRLFLSGVLILMTYVLYGLGKRSVLVAQRRLSLEQAIERRDKALKAREERQAAEERGEEQSSPPPQLDYEQIDVEALSRQSGQLLNIVATIFFAVIAYFLWKDLLPALSKLNDFQVWHYAKDAVGEDGGKISVNVPVTLWNIIQSIFIAVVAVIAARNLPGFIEAFFLKRTAMEPASRYAFKTVTGYILLIIGLIIGFNKLGVEWSKLQFVVAALGVGIGFGLQEIIANFISGLIILFERPVRIGDYVTIGDQSGTVNRIQIRATTLGDLDNKEILIPNKELITGRVTNWTLSNSVTRLIVPVGVAYGTDTNKAHQVMMDTIKANPNVLKEPGPQVLFRGFGDSSLDFELRVFLKTFDERVPVGHALHMAINEALEKADITIPFPQRDLHIITPPDQAVLDKTVGDKAANPKSKPAS